MRDAKAPRLVNRGQAVPTNPRLSCARGGSVLLTIADQLVFELRDQRVMRRWIATRGEEARVLEVENDRAAAVVLGAEEHLLAEADDGLWVVGLHRAQRLAQSGVADAPLLAERLVHRARRDGGAAGELLPVDEVDALHEGAAIDEVEELDHHVAPAGQLGAVTGPVDHEVVNQ